MKKQKKVMFLTLAILVVLCGLAAGIVMHRIQKAKIVDTLNKANITWYSESEETFTITTVKELFDLAVLSDFYDFKDQTILLEADIIVNEGNAIDWADNAPEKLWFPIQGFAGTFDGQGHTISGLYGVGAGKSMGLFSDTNAKCKIKNFKLINSYFSTSGTQGVGGVASNGCGTFEKIYTDVIVSTDRYYAGGLIGRIDSGTESSVLARSTRISNCWFEGEIRLTSSSARMGGGLVGGIKIGNVRIEHCLSNGVINCAEYKDAYNVGGIVGSVGVIKGQNNNITLHVEDSLHVGTINAIYKTSAGNAIGNVYKGTTVKYNNSYTEKNGFNPTDVSSGSVSGDALGLSKKYLIGEEAYRWAELNFNTYWVAVAEKTPELKCFSTETALDLTDVKKAYNMEWYDEEGKNYIIDSVEDLYGFQMLCNQNVTFEGKTVTLAKDIVVNEGKATDWAKGKNLPELEWTPIGGGGNKHRPFSGTFDGQGHTVSGLYMKSDDLYMGFFGVLNMAGKATIKNFKLTNTYFECTRTEDLGSEIDGLGGIAGQGAGVLDTVYCNAILVSGTRNTGGLIGNQRQKDAPLTVTNCWFDGKITGTKFIGGIVGYVYAYVKNTIISDCLVTADLTSTFKEEKDVSYVGGIAGRISNGSVKSCLVSGKLTGMKAVRGIVGQNIALKDMQVIFEKCYSTTDTKTMYENGSGGKTLAIASLLVKEDDIKGTDGYVKTMLNFYEGGKKNNGKWVAVQGKIPQLKSFATGKTLSVKGLPHRYVDYDISWYDASKKTFTIKNVAQLYGVAVLTNGDIGDIFKEKTIKLGADIQVNKGLATEWAQGNNLPTYTWTPIGGGEDSNNHRPFAGTFDGQGHTISGLYMKTDGYYLGFFGVLAKEGRSTVKNLKLINSYFERTKREELASELEGLGSVVGQGAGTLDTIYSDVILVNATKNTGGIIGNLRQKDAPLTMKNCWYNGSITGTTWMGGLLGFANSNVGDSNISDCLVTADITSTLETGTICIGGLAGRMIAGVVDSCIATGKLTGQGSSVRGLFSAVVTIGEAKKLEIKKCYNATNVDKLYNVARKQPTASHVKTVKSSELVGTKAYENTLLGFYDKNTNKSANWVIVNDNIPGLKSFTAGNYVADLSALSNVERPILADITWYDETKTTFTIKNKEQLYGLSELCNAGVTFAGKTVKLGANIEVNKGKATDWAKGTNIPAHTWVPIGGGVDSLDHVPFAGTFDGQGHTISGLYMKSDGYYLGLFGVLVKDGSSTIKNLKLTNSYFECTRTDSLPSEVEGLGSIAGQGAGTLDTIYSDVILVNKTRNTGGIVGNLRQKDATLNIKNCWYDGQITGTTWIGGILGFVESNVGYTNMKDCLVTADLTTTLTSGTICIGGLSGRITAGTVDSCLVSGQLVGTGNSVRGLIAATVVKETQKLVLTKCYNATNVATHYNNALKAPITSEVKHISIDALKGTKAYTNTLLDFYDKNDNKTGKWVLVENEIPELQSFAKSNYIADLGSLGDLIRPVVVDTAWYNETDTEFTICTPGELYGFAQLCNEGNQFAGKTIKLGSDIKVNIGLATDWAKGQELPNNEWIPIGGGTSTGNRFAGTFDGQGHSISGLYMKTAGDFLGFFGWLENTSTVKNFKLLNSYFECTKTATLGGETDGLGSIAGQGAGTIDSVYSDAILVSNKWHVGGFVGCIRTISNALTLNVTNCWFDGSVEGTRWLGGIVGFVYANSTTNISDCLVTADIKATDTTTGVYATVGGVLGRGVLGNITSCIAVGNIKSNYSQGGLIGNAMTGNTVKAENCFHVMTKDGTVQSTCLSGTLASTTNVKQLSSVDVLKGTGGYSKHVYVLDVYDADVNPDGKWVVIKEELPELRTFTTKEYLEKVKEFSPIIADVSWYNNIDTTFVIDTPEELYGFAQLCNEGNQFAGKTIKLGADITVNEGKAIDWAEEKNLPLNMWIPIGGGTSTGNRFAGTFDGQGYTISGLYMKSGGDFLGLFGWLENTSTVKNFKLLNSYFECTKTATLGGETDGLGSVAGQGAGTIDSVYSDAILVSNKWHVGGLVGCVRTISNALTLNVTNCWFNGSVQGTRWLGGIVGFVYANSTTNISDCLVTADFKATDTSTSVYATVGGVSGRGVLGNITSCVVIGIVESNYSQGGLIGNAMTGNTVKAENCFHVMTKGTAIQSACLSGAMSSSINVKQLPSVDALKGTTGYSNHLYVLDVYDADTNPDGKWVVIKDEIPELRTFTTKEYMDQVKEFYPLIPDISWYNDTDTTFIIDTPEELYGLAQLCNEGNTFVGKTIKLGADITVNNGKATDWAEGKNLPRNMWTPIGGGTDSKTSDRMFKGNFDGQGHTISGVYTKLSAYYVGLFGYIDSNSTIENFKLTNSYFEKVGATSGVSINGAENDGIGSIAGHAAATFKSIYSDAIVVSAARNAGGFVGSITSATALKIQNCWFNGKVTGTCWIGGILGFAKNTGSNVTLEDCLVTADLACNTTLTYGAPGGLAGRSTGGTFTSCVTAGTISVTGGKAAPYGLISNINMTGGKPVNMSNCYNAMTSKGSLVANNGGTPTSANNIQQIQSDKLKGQNAYLNTVLDFYVAKWNEEGRWAAMKENGMLQLKSFADADKVDGLADVTRPIVANTSWYNTTDTEFVINTAGELYGLAQLCNAGNTFAGKTIKLGKNIVINTGDAKTWSSTEPLNKWTPIGGGTDSKTSDRMFKGNFDGQGHTISGVYTKLSAYYVGLFGYIDSNSTIENFKLTNSYFEKVGATSGVSINGAENDGIGSVAGHAAATFKSIYSDAIVVSAARNAGGFVGSITSATALKIQNCWFNGKVTGTCWIGGILGFAKNTGSNVTMEDCLVTADLACNTTLTYGAPGGLAGRSTGGTFTSCVTAGTISVTGGKAAPYGLISNINMTGGKPVNMSNCYNAMTSNDASVANNGGTPSSTNNVKQVGEDNLKGANGYINYLKVLDFYDVASNPNGKWVLIDNKLPELRSFTTAEYMITLPATQ